MTKPSGVHLPNISRHYQHPYNPPRESAQASQASSGDSAQDNVYRDNVRQDNVRQDNADPRGSRQDSRRSGMARPRYLLAGSSIAAGLLLMVDVGSVKQPAEKQAVEQAVCQSIVQSEAFLSRDALAQLLSIPERESKAVVKQVLGEPHCTLSPLEIRAGVQAEREVYPLTFDEKAWVIVLYEGDEYAGYDFKFAND